MKKQIKRLSPHQNGKVIGILLAACSFVFVLFTVTLNSFTVFGIANGKGLIVLLAAPVVYFIMGYLFTALFCFIYNFTFQYIGGIEFEVKNLDSHSE